MNDLVSLLLSNPPPGARIRRVGDRPDLRHELRAALAACARCLNHLKAAEPGKVFTFDRSAFSVE